MYVRWVVHTPQNTKCQSIQQLTLAFYVKYDVLTTVCANLWLNMTKPTFKKVYIPSCGVHNIIRNSIYFCEGSCRSILTEYKISISAETHYDILC